jgi:hypothetical protein
LKDEYQLFTCGLSPSNVDGVTEEHPILTRPSKKQATIIRAKNYLMMKLGQFENLTWDDSVFKKLDVKSYDIIIVNDPREMPLAAALNKSNSKNAKIYFDLHEWYDEVDKDELVNNIFRSLTDKYFPLADITSTVNDEIADLYEQKYGRRPTIVTNAGRYFDIMPTPVAQDKIKMVHHGVLNTSRKLEEMIRLMDHLDDRFSLDLYLVGADEVYKNKLVQISDTKKVRFLPPVKFDNIVPTLSRYDIGLFILQPDVESYKYALPNKLFEFIQGRLALAISPNISMKKIVERYGLGVVGDDFSAEALARKLNSLTADDINEMKSKSHATAAILNDEQGIKAIRQIISSFEK